MFFLWSSEWCLRVGFNTSAVSLWYKLYYKSYKVFLIQMTTCSKCCQVQNTPEPPEEAAAVSCSGAGGPDGAATVSKHSFCPERHGPDWFHSGPDWFYSGPDWFHSGLPTSGDTFSTFRSSINLHLRCHLHFLLFIISSVFHPAHFVTKVFLTFSNPHLVNLHLTEPPSLNPHLAELPPSWTSTSLNLPHWTSTLLNLHLAGFICTQNISRIISQKLHFDFFACRGMKICFSMFTKMDDMRAPLLAGCSTDQSLPLRVSRWVILDHFYHTDEVFFRSVFGFN